MSSMVIICHLFLIAVVSDMRVECNWVVFTHTLDLILCSETWWHTCLVELLANFEIINYAFAYSLHPMFVNHQVKQMCWPFRSNIHWCWSLLNAQNADTGTCWCPWAHCWTRRSRHTLYKKPQLESFGPFIQINLCLQYLKFSQDVAEDRSCSGYYAGLTGK